MKRITKRFGVTLKIFIVTSLLLVFSASAIYTAFYFFLPHFYLSHKQSTLEKGAKEISELVKHRSLREAIQLLDEYSEQHNVNLFVYDERGYIYYIPSYYFRITNGRITSTRVQINPQVPIISFNRRNFFFDRFSSGDESRILTVNQPIHFLNDQNNYTLLISSPVQPIDEASEVILLLLPYMLGFILIISLVGAFIYSKLIAKPLLNLNMMAKRLSGLDFSTQGTRHSNDEIGELTNSLNEMAINLQRTMDELRHANAQLKDDIQKEREMEAKRREFVATISHELKTPITAVSGQLEGMIHQIGAYKDRDKYLKQSYQIMKDMEQLVQELLTLSKLDSAHLEPKFEEVNFSELIEESMEAYSYIVSTQQIKLKQSLEPNLLIWADQALLRKALSNILGNAFHYATEAKQVEVSLTREGSEWCLSVHNSGAQIDEVHFKHLFEPFYRIEKSRSRKTGGSGLGLFIVKKILDLHQFKYEISNTDRGVLFIISFKAEERTLSKETYSHPNSNI